MAKRRNIEFGLTLDEFKIFLNNPCFYCGTTLKNIGLDRIDNTKGYIKDNCCSCCKVCNSMKSKLTKEDFITHIKKIVGNI